MNSLSIAALMFLLSCAQFANLTLADDKNSQSAAALAVEIDRLIEARWQKDSVTPAPVCDDAEFIRRVYLDICGKIPRASDVRDFLADQTPDKRTKLVDRLLETPSYVIHYTNLWRAAMIPEAEADQQIRFALPGFESWLRSRIAENSNFAEITEEMLTFPVTQENSQPFAQATQSNPAAFYLAKESKPEQVAAATSRLFLGVRIDCAQCHDHPFDVWKQHQFWSYAAFFTDVQQPTGAVEQIATAFTSKTRTIKIPDTGQTVEAKFLDGGAPEWQADDENRAVLAKWIIRENNPYFAKAAANRIWSYHFGIGLVEPMDDFSPGNPPSHPELLDLLATSFVDSGYDFKFMIRAITASQTYQRTSRQTDESQSDPRVFARMAVRGMTPEQIFDSLAQATGYLQPFDPEQPLNFNNDQARQEFIETFSNQTESALDRSSTILQALALMNGDFVGDATDLADSRTLAAVIDAPFLANDKKIEALYLATLSRQPSAAEQEYCLKYLTSEATAGDSGRGLSDLFWALLNSSEFLLNH